MDGLPDQHIDALPKPNRGDAYIQVGTVCAYRSQGLPEVEIAKRAKFSSVEDMHFRLKRWGLPGLVPLEKAGKEPPKAKRPKASQEHKPHSSGQPEEVPNPSAAAGLFKEALDQLRGQVELLEHLSLVYQGGYFAGTYTFEDSWVWPPSRSSEERWQELSKQDKDPGTEGISVRATSSNHPTEASPFPPRELVALIAAYALLGSPIEPLLEVLYPKHSQADIKEIYKRLLQTKSPKTKTENGLLRTAQQFAAAVYGHKVERGARGESPAHEEVLAWYINQRREAGIKHEEIFQEILTSGRELSKKEFNRLANFRRRFPNAEPT
jgi:hypothetical protein